MGHKGARLSTKISLAGRYLVLRARRQRRIRVSRQCDAIACTVSKQLKAKDAVVGAEGHGLEDLKQPAHRCGRASRRPTVEPRARKEVDVSIEVARAEPLQRHPPDASHGVNPQGGPTQSHGAAFLDKEAPELLPRSTVTTARSLLKAPIKKRHRPTPRPAAEQQQLQCREALTGDRCQKHPASSGKGLEDTIAKTNLEAAARSCVSSACATSAASSSSTPSTAHAKTRWCWRRWRPTRSDRTKTYVVETLAPRPHRGVTHQRTARACAFPGLPRQDEEKPMALNVPSAACAPSAPHKSAANNWSRVNGAVAERLSGDHVLEKEVPAGACLSKAAGLRWRTSSAC